jgi:hypothetical protein
MATSTTVDRNAALTGRKTVLEAAGPLAAPSLCWMAGATLLIRQFTTGITTPSNGDMDLSLGAATAAQTGTVTELQVRDRNDAVHRTFTVGGPGSGRDIVVSIVAGSGSGVSFDGSNNLVVSQAGAGIDPWVLRYTQQA